MAARIALVDLAEGTALAVQAALGAGAVRVCRRGAVPDGAALVIVEADGPLRDDIGLADAATPLLVIADRMSAATVEVGGRRFSILEKPFGSEDLRQKVRALLEPAPNPERSPSAAAMRWLGEPFVETGAARTLSAARGAIGSVWVVGEPGTGTEEVAAALLHCWGTERVVWAEDEPLAAALVRLAASPAALWAPAIDERPAAEQGAFERLLAFEPQRRIVATSSGDPERGGMLRASLAARLSRLSVRLAPLRERRRTVASLALALGRDIAAQLAPGARLELTDRAKRALEAYDWPYNLVELESLLTRSIASWGDARSGERRDPEHAAGGLTSGHAIELDADDLLFAPNHLAPLFADDGAPETETETETAPRRAVVVALGDVAAARAAAGPAVQASTLAASQRDAAVLAGKATTQPPTGSDEPGDAGIEGVLAGFAHDIRNPMSTIKTFASLEAGRDGNDSAELARLAAQACERVDEQLELLQRYSEIGALSASAADLVEILGEAIEAAGAEDDLLISARRALTVRIDPVLARLIADAIVAECRARRAPESGDEPSIADIGPATGPGTATLEVTIPTGRAAVDRLDKWVAGTRFPWRLALARDAARRAGGSLEVEVEDGQIRLAWRLSVVSEPVGSTSGEPAGSTAGGRAGSSVVEGRKDDDQAGSPDRRRRSRSS